MWSRRPQLLIVDDEVDICENLSDILTDVGYAVDVAYDGITALDLVKQNGYDVALLDLRMPGMDGLELYRRMKQFSAGTLAIVVSAYADSDTARSILDAGAWRIVSKPVDMESLLALVGEAISHPLVLVVDDNTEFRENLWDIFGPYGYRVHLAQNADDADEALRKHEFQVVLLDMKLPGRDGSDVIDRIRQANHHTKIILITGFAEEMKSRIEKALAAGVAGICYKPVEAKSLLATVHEMLECK